MEFVKSVSIIGVGLIGGSLGLALKERFPNITITGIGRDPERLTIAKKKGCIDNFTLDLVSGVENADLVVISTPIKLTIEFIKKVLPLVKDGCIITDVASVKYAVIKSVSKDVCKYRKIKNVNFVGSHPLAGSEKSGFEYADKKLFVGSVCVVCYDKKLSSREGFDTVKLLWENVGAKVVHLDPKEHDKIIAATSHLLHLVSYALVEQIVKRKGYQVFTAGAFRDMTRIAGSNPELWSEICYYNKTFLKNEIDRFLKIMKKFQNNLNDLEQLKKMLTIPYNLKTKK